MRGSTDASRSSCDRLAIIMHVPLRTVLTWKRTLGFWRGKRHEQAALERARPGLCNTIDV